MSKDVVQRSKNRFYFRDETLDFFVGWLLGYAQAGGASPGAIFHCLNQIHRPTPKAWVVGFTRLLDAEEQAAGDTGMDPKIRAMHLRSASEAARAGLNLSVPGSQQNLDLVERMESCFQQALALEGLPVHAWEIPFGNHTLPAYVSDDVAEASTLVVVVGGGDTYREDLWYFGGQAALADGYAALMVDLPGQGSAPDRGMCFSEDTLAGLDVAIRAVRGLGFTGKTVLMGWSGGGFFTAKYVELYGGIDAWVASTPIRDMVRIFEVAMPSMLRDPNAPLTKVALAIGGAVSPVLQMTLAKYTHQFGPGGIGTALEKLRDFGPLDVGKVQCPLLGLVGASEDAELRRQAEEVYEGVRRRYPASKLVEFPAESGADAHSQVTNLPLALAHVSYWLRNDVFRDET